jgi:hypothetical protein
MISLKRARSEGNLEEFLKEREKDAPGDQERLVKAIDQLSRGKSKSVQETSEKDSHES